MAPKTQINYTPEHSDAVGDSDSFGIRWRRKWSIGSSGVIVRQGRLGQVERISHDARTRWLACAVRVNQNFSNEMLADCCGIGRCMACESVVWTGKSMRKREGQGVEGVVMQSDTRPDCDWHWSCSHSNKPPFSSVSRRSLAGR